MDTDTTDAAWHQAEQEEQQQMTTDTVAAFNAAYAAAQAECENPPLDSINPAFRSKFSSLAATRNAVIPVFAKHGIAIQQTPMTEMIGERLFAGVRTVLRHKDGHVEDLGACPMPVMKADPQGIASCLTYSKRQSLQAIAGVTGETDDDANDASGKAGQPEPIDKAADAEKTQYAVALKKAVQAIDADKVWKIHLDLHAEGEEFYRSVWERLDATTRGKAKDFIDLKKREAA